MSTGRSAAGASTTTLCPARVGSRDRASAARRNSFALGALAGQLARAANRFRLFAGAPFGRLFVVVAELHLAEKPLALHLLLESFEGLVDVIVANEYLQARRPVLE